MFESLAIAKEVLDRILGPDWEKAEISDGMLAGLVVALAGMIVTRAIGQGPCAAASLADQLSDSLKSKVDEICRDAARPGPQG